MQGEPDRERTLHVKVSDGNPSPSGSARVARAIDRWLPWLTALAGGIAFTAATVKWSAEQATTEWRDLLNGVQSTSADVRSASLLTARVKFTMYSDERKEQLTLLATSLAAHDSSPAVRATAVELLTWSDFPETLLRDLALPALLQRSRALVDEGRLYVEHSRDPDAPIEQTGAEARARDVGVAIASALRRLLRPGAPRKWAEGASAGPASAPRCHVCSRGGGFLDLSNTYLALCNFDGIEFPEGMTFHGSILTGSKLRKARLDAACFNCADLQQADFSDAQLSRACFTAEPDDTVPARGSPWFLWNALVLESIHTERGRKDANEVADRLNPLPVWLKGPILRGAQIGGAQFDGQILVCLVDEENLHRVSVVPWDFTSSRVSDNTDFSHARMLVVCDAKDVGPRVQGEFEETWEVNDHSRDPAKSGEAGSLDWKAKYWCGYVEELGAASLNWIDEFEASREAATAFWVDRGTGSPVIDKLLAR